ncbi:MAG: lysozyme [Caulobacterales bacterium]
MTRLTVSERGVALIKRFEGFRAEGLELPDGQRLIGYGGTKMSAPEPVTAEQAHSELLLDLVPYEDAVHEHISQPLTQAQFDALVSFAFSVGLAAFGRSDVVRRVNGGDFAAAGAALEAWRKSGVLGETVVLDALVRRRVAERAMLLEDDDPRPIPSVFVRPQIDHAAAILGAPLTMGVMPELETAIAAANGAALSAVSDDADMAPAMDPVAARIAAILSGEPATASALMVAAKPAEPEPSVITTMNDADPADASELPAATLIPIFAAPKANAPHSATRSYNADWIALGALFVFGMGLLLLAGLSVSQAASSPDGWLAGAVLGAPGLLAISMGLYQVMKGLPPREIEAKTTTT